ncbi:glycosyltransferase [Litorisediminicola beolgyonensis]|uniref:Glycosyltransferase n=1 Tax=Litorisediminicola beolgyonensis TaxID=1173614 RepID=A0ABW3ZIH5_9RHOB
MSTVDLVLIGRNEGQRLIDALRAATGQARRIVYVDSGSTDGSVDAARAAGAEIVTLDTSTPFTAARARNAGAAALAYDPPDYVQFIDGDCALVPGWVAAGVAFLDQNPGHALVAGWRSEKSPEASLYNRLCDWEWHRPAGEIEACGGDMLVRWSAFEATEGFDPTVIAAEDDELCQRLRKAGWSLHRLPHEMTRHDAAMTRFGQWWRRAERTGHGFAQVGHLHPQYFVTERRRALVYGAALPLGACALGLLWPPLVLGPLAAYGLNFQRTRARLRREEASDPTGFAALLTLSKLPNLIGMARFHLRRLRGAEMRLIEYKGPEIRP